MDDSTISGILELHDIEEDDSLKEFPKESDIKISIDWNKEDGVADKDYPKFYKEKRVRFSILLHKIARLVHLILSVFCSDQGIL